MTAYFFVVPDRSPFATLEDALRGARFMLGNGAPSAWIADGAGNLVLPADQVRLRLNLPRLAPSNDAGPAPQTALPFPSWILNANEDAQGGFTMETKHIESVVETALAYMKSIFGIPSGEKPPLGQASRGAQTTTPEPGLASEDAASAGEYTFKSVAEVYTERARSENRE
jgi:hypothetical protein